jgi:hypothetical protein
MFWFRGGDGLCRLFGQIAVFGSGDSLISLLF